LLYPFRKTLSSTPYFEETQIVLIIKAFNHFKSDLRNEAIMARVDEAGTFIDLYTCAKANP